LRELKATTPRERQEGQRVDTSEYPSLTRLAHLNAQLAVQSARVGAIVGPQLDSVERLFKAATNHDWATVARVSQDLARQPENAANATMVRSAGKVCEALRADPSGAKAARPLAKLLDACRAAKKAL
jgi:hypothetical protein